MKVKDWLDEFLVRHQVRNPRDDWPKQKTEAYRELWRGFIDAFIHYSVRKSEADEASITLAAGEPPQWVEDHLAELLRLIDKRRAEPKPERPARQKAKIVTQNSTFQVSAELRKCPYCCGHGIAEVWSTPTSEQPQSIRAATFCSCQSGLWIKTKCKFDDNRILVDFAQVEAGTATGWNISDPTRIDIEIPEGLKLSDWRQVVDQFAKRIKA